MHELLLDIDYMHRTSQTVWGKMLIKSPHAAVRPRGRSASRLQLFPAPSPHPPQRYLILK